MRNRRTLMTGFGAAALATVASAPEVDDDDAIRDILRRRVEVEKRAVGMAACVVTPHRSHYVTWGRARLGDNRPVTSDTVFEIASVTKVFTALLLANMADRGEVRLGDPVTRHLPGDFHVPLLDGRLITLTDLATHTSGLPRWPSIPGSPPPSSPAYLEYAARFSVEDLRAWLADFHPEPHPPTAAGWWYSNVGYTLLGMALAHRGGRPFETLMRDRVLDPIGLKETRFEPTMAMRGRMAESHDSALKPIPPNGRGILFTASGGLLATPRDLARFAGAILPGSSARIASDNQLLLTVQRAAPWINGRQALGWEVRNAPGGQFISKDGVSAGQAASMVFDPEKRLAIVVFSNAFPDETAATLSGGGVGSADIAQHLLRPQILLGGQGGARY